MYRVSNNNNSYQDTNKENRQNYQNYSKTLCIDHIYNTVDLPRFKYKLLEFEPELNILKQEKFFVSPNYSGSNCLLVFSKIKEKYHQFLVDRKSISYSRKKVNDDQVKLQYVNLKLDINIYKDRGSIFDGIFVQNKNSKIFIVTDVYMFKGQDMTNTKLDSKLLSLSTYLNSKYNQSDKNNDFKILINDLHDLNEIDNLINKKIPEIKDFLIKGICLYPEYPGLKKLDDDTELGIKRIFMFDNKTREFNNNDFTQKNENNKKIQSESYNNNQSYNNQSCQELKSESRTKSSDTQFIIPAYKKIDKNIYIPKSSSLDTNYIFEMKKTDIIDVYDLNIGESVIKDGKKLLKKIKIGLAFVSGLERSKWCQNVINENNGKLLVHCKFHEDKQKWEPISIADEKRPSLTNEFMVVTV
jgi:hypothetical protein